MRLLITMKRYMLASYQIDSRPLQLQDPPGDWDDVARAAAEARKRAVLSELEFQYGRASMETKARDFEDIGPFPQSVIGYHNVFLTETRSAFTIGAYFPALTGATSLGERLLNHMLISLHGSFPKSRRYKRAVAIARRGGDTHWRNLIEILVSWDVLLPAATHENASYPIVADLFERLCDLRNRAVHYHGGVIDTDVRGAALEAIIAVQAIILRQFGLFAYQPWFMRDTPGAQFITKSAESAPFVRQYYLPNCLYVGPHHRIESRDGVFQVIDDGPYETRDISDDEFRRLWLESRATP